MINHQLVKMGFNLSSSIFIILLFKLLTHGLPLQEEELFEGSHCKLENSKTGVCKKIHDCPSKLREVLEGKRNSDSNGRCGFQDFTEIVCCQFNITDKIGLRPAEIACREYENEIGTGKAVRTENEVQFHIFSGMEAERGEFPYMVALGYEDDNEDSDAIKYNCGGTLISSQFVLTAAHCVNNVQEKVPIEVRVGSEDLKSAGDDAQRIPIIDVITHPRYKRSMNYNDVAILKLRAPVQMASNVRPICIQTKSLATMNRSPNTSFIVIGWGATSFADDGTNKLMKTPSLLDETDPESNVSPLFEIQLSLEVPHIVFRPAVDPDDPEGFYAFYESILLDIMKMGALVPRVDPDIATEREHYGVRRCI